MLKARRSNCTTPSTGAAGWGGACIVDLGIGRALSAQAARNALPRLAITAVEHRAGHVVIRCRVFGWCRRPARAPERHDFPVGNAVRLLKQAYVGCVSRCRAVGRLALAVLISRAAEAQRGSQLADIAGQHPRGRIE